MIESVTFLKTLNATDCNNTGAHAVGLSFPKKYNVALFPNLVSNEFRFKAYDNVLKKSFDLRLVIRPANNQQYITGFSDYIRTKGLQAGDVVCLERRTTDINGGQTLYYLSVIKRYGILILQSFSKGFVVIRNDIGNNFFGRVQQCLYDGLPANLLVSFDKTDKIRANASDVADFYNVQLNGSEIKDVISDTFIEIDTNTKIIRGVKDVQFVIINQ
jgi:hypothetical protein